MQIRWLLVVACLSACIASSASASQPDAGSLDPTGRYDYPASSLAAQEIHGELPTPFLDEFDAQMRAAADASQRRAAQIRVLGLIRQDPRGLFRQLRARRPVFPLPDLDLTLVTRDADVRAVLSNPTVFSVRDYRYRMEPVVGRYMLNDDADPYYNVEEKAWMRALMSPRDLAHVRSIVAAYTAQVIQATTSHQLDVVSAFGRAVPTHVVREYFGFRAPEQNLLRWSFETQDSFFHNVGYVRGFRGALIRWFGIGGAEVQRAQREAHDVQLAGERAGVEMRAFLTEDVKRRRDETPGEDTILSRMLATNPSASHPKPEARLVANVMGTLIGAVETTNAAIVQSLDQLLKHPDALANARLAASAVSTDAPIQDSSFAKYVWEALRFHPINPFVVRYVESDTWVGPPGNALRVRNGTRVLVATHSAMLDPRAVYDPDRFVADRPERDREMTLGYGHHRCLGDMVAQVMVPEVLRQLVALRDVESVPPTPPLPTNEGIDFGPRGSFPEHYWIRWR